jgi:hypothetical protein
MKEKGTLINEPTMMVKRIREMTTNSLIKVLSILLKENMKR